MKVTLLKELMFMNEWMLDQTCSSCIMMEHSYDCTFISC